MLVLTTAQMKRAEQLATTTGVSYMDLMRNAGDMAYHYCNTHFDILNKKSVILCGNGNNAGDGFVIAKQIQDCGGKVSVIMCCGNPKTEESKTAFAELQIKPIELIDLELQSEIAKERIATADCIIDAVYGTGFHGELSSNLSNLFSFANRISAAKIALDIPSGINADTGVCAVNHFIADFTLVFGALKYAHTSQCKNMCGQIEVLDIGISNELLNIAKYNVNLITKETVVPLFPKRSPSAHKGTYGKFLNISGSKTMCGAAMMSTMAAMRIGAGVTTLATPECVADICATNLMEAMTFPLQQSREGSISANAMYDLGKLLANADGCLIGCGLSVTNDTKLVVNFVVENTDSNIVIDADALNCISKDLSILEKLQTTAILTPHPGEMARLAGITVSQIQKEPYKIALDFVEKYKVYLVLKGYKTIIATPQGELYENTSGNAGLAKGGSGDILAGMIAGLLTQGFEPINAAIGAVYLHGLVADELSEKMSQYSILARDIIEQIPYTLKGLEQS